MTRSTGQVNFGFYATPPYACSYLPDRLATTLFADPNVRKDPALYAVLSAHGFRRSGEHLYRPRCQACQACVPVRVPVADFRPRRCQTRTLTVNDDLSVRVVPAYFQEEHFALYKRYLAARHAGGGMDNPSRESYVDFLLSTWADTFFLELRAGRGLAAIAVVDRMEDALSAVYTFYDPDLHKRSLGRYAVLQEIEYARQQGLRWLYLGYWIRECRKMRYKNEYQPLEYYRDGTWQRTGSA